MDAICTEHGKPLNQKDLEEFKKLAEPVVKLIQEKGDPYCKAVIGYDGGELYSGEMGFRVEVPD